MSDVVVREGRAQDEPTLRRLVAETIGEPAADLQPVEPGPPGDVVFVAEVGGHPAGYAAARVDGSVLMVDRVMVAPADRGRHVGHRLLDWLEGYGVQAAASSACGSRSRPRTGPPGSSTAAAGTRPGRARWSATCRISERAGARHGQPVPGARRPSIRYRPPMAKIRLVPQTREFYTLFDRAAQNLVTTAQLLLDLLEHCPDRRDLVDQIKDCEHEGDRVTHDIVQLVNKTFVTPIDGEDIYDLATALDDVCDFMDQVADELNLYGVDEVPPQAIEQAVVILSAVGKLADAIARLDGLRDISDLLVEIHTLEDEGDQIVRAATARLFRDGHDPLVVIRWKDIHEHLEQAVDSCERSAHVLESIYLKHR